MTDFERSTTVGVGADAAFAFLSDPAHIPDYVTTVRLEESIAVDGDPGAEREAGGRAEAAEARFLADAATRRIEWGEPDGGYGGSITVTAGTTSTSGVTIRLHVRDDADRAEVERIVDQTIRNLQRLLSGR